MRKLATSSISDSSQMPIKSGTLDHIQLAYKEGIGAIVTSFLGAYYDTSKVYIVSGCKNTGSGSSYSISAGWLFYNGELYQCDAASFTAGVGEVAVVSKITLSYLINADPVTFSNGDVHNVHLIEKMQITAGASGSGFVDFSNVLDIKLDSQPIVLANKKTIPSGTVGITTIDLLVPSSLSAVSDLNILKNCRNWDIVKQKTGTTGPEKTGLSIDSIAIVEVSGSRYIRASWWEGAIDVDAVVYVTINLYPNLF